MHRRPAWLPHLIAVTVVIGAAVIDTVATLSVGRDPIAPELTRVIAGWRLPGLTAVFAALTVLGYDPITFGFTGWFAWWCWRRRATRAAVTMPVAAISARLVVILLKAAVSAHRPDLMPPPEPFQRAYDFSYPSGHAVMALVVISLFVLIRLQLNPPVHHRILFLASAAFLVLGIGFSRVYLGYHWMNDVLAGYLYGSAIVIIAAWWLRRDPPVSGES
jgi:undecaprenyl-diphosphatase